MIRQRKCCLFSSSSVPKQQQNNNRLSLLSLLLFWIVVVQLSLSSSSSVVVVEAAKKSDRRKCLEEDITRGKELKKHVMENHVLVSLQQQQQEEEDNKSNDDDEDENDDDENEDNENDNDEYKELCERLEQTPYERVKDFEIVVVKDSSFRKKVMSKAKIITNTPSSMMDQMKGLLGLSSSNDDGNDENNKKQEQPQPNYPEYVLFQKGNFDTAIRYYDNDNDNTDNSSSSGGRENNNKLSADSISEFVAKHLQRKKIGNFVYSLGTFDLITSQFMKSMKESNTSDDDDPLLLQKTTTTTSSSEEVMKKRDIIHYWKAMGWAYMGKIMALIQQYKPDRIISGLQMMISSNKNIQQQPREDLIESDKLANTYVKTMFAILDKGLEYPQKQIERLSTMIENDSDNLSDLKIEQLQQRMYTLQKFNEESTANITDEQVRNFLLYAAVNSALWIAIVIMIPLLCLTSDDDDEYEEEYDDDNEGEEDEKQKKKTVIKDDDEEESNNQANGSHKKDDENGRAEKKKEE